MVRRAEKANAMIRCQAILCCTDPERRASQCESTDTEMSDDGRRWLCWVHRSAAANPHRTRPLEYVRSGPNLEALLERSIRLAGGAH